MRGAAYWRERGAQNERKADRFATRQAELVTRWFGDAAGAMASRIQHFHDRYATKHGLNIAEAKQALADPVALQATLRDYERLVQALEFDPTAGEALDKLYYGRAISRLEHLQAQLDLITSSLYARYEQFTAESLTTMFEAAYYKSIFDHQQFRGVGRPFERLNTNAIAAAAHTEWSGKHYSERIWTQRDMLAERLDRIITSGVIAGRSGKEMAQALRQEMDTSAFNARRLIRTETNYVFNQGNLRGYEQNGTRQYEFLAVLDLRTSEVCRGLDGKVFDVGNARTSVNLPPLHPFCRSTTVPYVPDEDFDKDATRVARRHTGESYTVPASMTYREWHAQHVAGAPEAIAHEAALRNIGRDLQQYARYQAMFGAERFPTLEHFQREKYNRGEIHWQQLKWDYGFAAKHMAKSPSELLTNHEHATGIGVKLATYSLSPEHHSGRHKARILKGALGFDLSNADALDVAIRQGLARWKAVDAGNRGYGTKFEVHMLITGPNGNTQPLLTGWLYDESPTIPRMVTAYVNGKNKRPRSQ